MSPDFWMGLYYGVLLGFAVVLAVWGCSLFAGDKS